MPYPQGDASTEHGRKTKQGLSEALPPRRPNVLRLSAEAALSASASGHSYNNREQDVQGLGLVARRAQVCAEGAGDTAGAEDAAGVADTVVRAGARVANRAAVVNVNVGRDALVAADERVARCNIAACAACQHVASRG